MKKHLRIALVFDDSLDRPDGVQQYVRLLGDWLSSRGHYVRYLVGETTDAGAIQDAVYSLSKNVAVNGNQNLLTLPLPASPRNISAILQKEQFDVVHVMMPYNPLMSGRVIKRLGPSVRLIGTFHIVGASWFERVGSRLLAFLQLRSLRRFNEIISVSTAAQRFAKRFFYIDSEVIPNAIDSKRFKLARAKKFLRPRKHTLVFLGRLVERKGADHLLKAMVILRDLRPLDDVTLHICGDGPLRAELEAYVKDHALRDTVQFHGFIDESEKADYLASADIAVFPATGGESFGIVLVEAMFSNDTLVLGGDNAGYRTVLESADFLFEPADHEALAEMIDGYLADPKKRQTAIKRQQKRAQQYDISVVGPKIEELYRR